jgi:hypothetical protein
MRGQKNWAGLAAAERGKYLREIAAKVRDRTDFSARIITRGNRETAWNSGANPEVPERIASGVPFSVIVAVFALASAVEDRAFVSPADKHTGSRRRRATLASGGWRELILLNTLLKPRPDLPVNRRPKNDPGANSP